LPNLSGVNHQAAIRAFEKVGFVIARQSGHVVMKRQQTILVIPRHNPVKPTVMGQLIKTAGLTIEEFKELL
jgi:predicted RNA binding protein YcfA (HicA-like mRNA interferase family)